MKSCDVGVLGRGYLTSWLRLTSISASLRTRMTSTMPSRERNQTLLQFANVARAAYLKHDAYGYTLPDRTKGMKASQDPRAPGRPHHGQDQRFGELFRSPRCHPDSGPETHESGVLEPELACMLENLQKGKKGSSKGFRRGNKGWSRGESPWCSETFNQGGRQGRSS